MDLSQAKIDAGAEALRERNEGQKRLRPWSQLPPSVKKKWQEQAYCVLKAAQTVVE